LNEQNSLAAILTKEAKKRSLLVSMTAIGKGKPWALARESGFLALFEENSRRFAVPDTPQTPTISAADANPTHHVRRAL